MVRGRSSSQPGSANGANDRPHAPVRRSPVAMRTNFILSLSAQLRSRTHRRTLSVIDRIPAHCRSRCRLATPQSQRVIPPPGLTQRRPSSASQRHEMLFHENSACSMCTDLKAEACYRYKLELQLLHSADYLPEHCALITTPDTSASRGPRSRKSSSPRCSKGVHSPQQCLTILLFA